MQISRKEISNYFQGNHKFSPINLENINIQNKENTNIAIDCDSGMKKLTKLSIYYFGRI